jgi:hypothetical protein
MAAALIFLIHLWLILDLQRDAAVTGHQVPRAGVLRPHSQLLLGYEWGVISWSFYGVFGSSCQGKLFEI